VRNSRLDRILYIQQVLVQGGVLNKQQTADRFGVSEKTIQRDLDTLRSYFADSEPRREILYNSAKGGYLLDDTLSRFLTSSEILAAFIEGIDKDKHFKNPQDNSPTIYRIDRIQNYKTLDRHFAQRYTDRFQEGEMRKRIQFMYGGELQTIRFEYTGPSLESVLDRLPTAKVLQVTEKGWIVEAEVFGTGIQMWVRSQGDYIKIINT
jgi:hypothetical protein